MVLGRLDFPPLCLLEPAFSKFIKTLIQLGSVGGFFSPLLIVTQSFVSRCSDTVGGCLWGLYIASSMELSRAVGEDARAG